MSPITTNGIGQVRSQPDKAIIRFSVVEKRDDANSARAALAERSAALRTAITELEIASDQLQATRYNLNEGRRPSRDDADSPTYTASQQFSIAVDDLTVTGQIIDTATEHGANRIEGVTHTFSEQKRRTLRNEALEDAMDHARQQADVLADRATLTISGVESIETSDVNISHRQTARHERESGVTTGSGTEIDTGPLRVMASVTVTYTTTQ